MKRLLILVGAICYCIAPDLLAGPMDDALVLLASTLVSSVVANVKQNRDPEYIKMNKNY